MGDARYQDALLQVKMARDRKAAMDELSFEELVLALGGASKEGEAYLANILASELLNRSRRGKAMVFSAGLGVSASVALFFLVASMFANHPHNFDDHVFLLLAFLTLLAGAMGAFLVRSPILSRLKDRRV